MRYIQNSYAVKTRVFLDVPTKENQLNQKPILDKNVTFTLTMK